MGVVFIPREIQVEVDIFGFGPSLSRRDGLVLYFVAAGRASPAKLVKYELRIAPFATRIVCDYSLDLVVYSGGLNP